jgi:hypothetical protein
MNALLKNIKHLLVVLIALIVLGACKKSFLEVTPTGRLIATKTNDYNLMLNSTDLINYAIGPVYTALGDEVISIDPTFGTRPAKDQRLFRYEDNVYDPAVEPSEITTLARVLYVYNKIINEVMDSEGGTNAEKSGIRAEALTGRAWIYLHFTNLFTKPYNPTTASTDLGFPIITIADVNISNYKRGTLKEVYDFMITDLTSAIPNLSPTISSRFRATRPLAQAFLAKVYLAMGRFNDALPVLDGAINNITVNTGVSMKLYDLNIELLPGGVLFNTSMAIIGPSLPTLPNNTESLYSRQETNSYNSSTNNYSVLSPAVAALYAASDLRRRYYNSTSLTYPIGCLRRLAPLIQPTGMNLPEIYLMRAECRARANSLYGSGSAAEDLLFLRQRRMPLANATIPSLLTQTQMINYVIEERLRETAFTGLRWFDMRRLSVDPLFSSKTYTHTLHFANGSIENYPLRPERLTLKIPPRILADNPGMEDNK